MASKQKLIVVNAKMYKHFALVTVGLTVVLALMADGESREAVVEQAADIQAYAEKPKDPVMVIANSSVSDSGGLGGFYSGAAPGSLTPVGGFSTAANSARNVPLLRKLVSAVTDVELKHLGITRDRFLTMSENDQEALLARLNGGVSPVTSRDTIELVSNSSLARSGGSGPSADF
ncbi:hypothetical protein [Pontixanthobacter sp.]|uniref:hypothetical protein n=1 Tax=Pontixanthobacter sp. TaxID=2792078 RepID=UPI003C79FA91